MWLEDAPGEERTKKLIRKTASLSPKSTRCKHFPEALFKSAHFNLRKEGRVRKKSKLKKHNCWGFSYENILIFHLYGKWCTIPTRSDIDVHLECTLVHHFHSLWRVDLTKFTWVLQSTGTALKIGIAPIGGAEAKWARAYYRTNETQLGWDQQEQETQERRKQLTHEEWGGGEHKLVWWWFVPDWTVNIQFMKQQKRHNS